MSELSDNTYLGNLPQPERSITRDIDKHNLVKGDVGTVVHCYADGEAYEVEFVTSSGDTIAVLTSEREDVRPISERDILHDGN